MIAATQTQVKSSPEAAARRQAAKDHLSALGLTVTRWASQEGYSRKTVYKVLAGDLLGTHGVSHNIAVKLGLKDGEVQAEFEPGAAVTGVVHDA